MWMLLQALGAAGGLVALGVYVVVVRDARATQGGRAALLAAVFPPYYAIRGFRHPRKAALLAGGALGFVLLLVGANATAFVGPDVTQASPEGAADDFDAAFDEPAP
jgi:hypothetical protein